MLRALDRDLAAGDVATTCVKSVVGVGVARLVPGDSINSGSIESNVAIPYEMILSVSTWAACSVLCCGILYVTVLVSQAEANSAFRILSAQ